MEDNIPFFASGIKNSKLTRFNNNNLPTTITVVDISADPFIFLTKHLYRPLSLSCTLLITSEPFTSWENRVKDLSIILLFTYHVFVGIGPPMGLHGMVPIRPLNKCIGSGRSVSNFGFTAKREHELKA